jgi:hypothetical protein
MEDITNLFEHLVSLENASKWVHVIFSIDNIDDILIYIFRKQHVTILLLCLKSSIPCLLQPFFKLKNVLQWSLLLKSLLQKISFYEGVILNYISYGEIIYC